MSEWIKCSDKLPDKDEYVLLYDKVLKMIYEGKLLGADFFYADRAGYSNDTDKNCSVSHWMPFPIPPEDGPRRVKKLEEIPFDEWTQLFNEELAKKGRAEWVYRPSGYTGPLAIDGFLKKETIDAPGAILNISREEAEAIFFQKE